MLLEEGMFQLLLNITHLPGKGVFTNIQENWVSRWVTVDTESGHSRSLTHNQIQSSGLVTRSQVWFWSL